MGILIKLALRALAVFIAAYILKTGVAVSDFTTAIIVAVVLGAVNVLVKPVMTILTLPLNIMTLGLFTFILNGLMIMLVSWIIPGFAVANIFWAILFSIVLSLISSFLDTLIK